MARPIPHHDYVCTCAEPDLNSHVCEPCAYLSAEYWAAYFGQGYGTKEQQRGRLMAMDPRPASDEQMDEYRRLK